MDTQMFYTNLLVHTEIWTDTAFFTQKLFFRTEISTARCLYTRDFKHKFMHTSCLTEMFAHNCFFECSGQPQNSTYVLAPYQPIQKPPQHPKTPKPSSNCVDASCQPAFSSMLDASKKGFVGQSLVPGNGSCRRQAS